ncbi:SwmB domain-containing protein [Paenibacillus amylolyticus]|uniref:SwmB domain-containing protein n=1 Tax=Paenibacillus amylolyticus TaxID=1451 RepID=UPI00201D8822|nr:Ig-like domain-containing protein [Paenibacillus amylolyticus]
MFVKKMARKGLASLMILMLVTQGILAGWVGVESAYAADELKEKGINTTSPAVNEQQASGSAPLTIDFIKPVKKIDASTEEIFIQRVQDDSIVTRVPVTDAAVTVVADDAAIDAALGKRVQIQLPAVLPGGSFYVRIGSQSFVYGDGQPVEGLNKEWTFRTTGVSTARLTGQSPLNAASNVSPSANIQLTYDRAMKVGAGKLQIYSGSTLLEEIDANSSRISFNTARTTVTIDPVNSWANNSTIYIAVPEGFLRDDLNNDTGAIQRTTWGFNVISDPTALTVSTLSPANGATGVSLTNEFTLTFNKDLDRNFASSATVKNANGGIVASTTLISTSNPRQLRIIPQTTLTSNTTYTIDIPANVFRDQTGNLFTGLNGATSWTFRTLTVDTTPPVLKTAKMYSNTIIRLTYDELLSSLDPFASSFTVTVNGENRNVSSSYVSGDSVYVVLDTGVAVGQVVRIAYAPGTGTRKIQDLSLNAAPAFGARDVENSLDSIMSKPREGTAYYNTISLYYPETVYINSSDAVRQFSVTADGSAVGVSSMSTNNSSLVTLNLSRSIQNGEVVQVSYAPGTWPVKDSRGQALAGFNGFYVRNSIDTKPPEFKSAEVSGTTMWIRYNEPLSRTNKPLKSQYSVLVDGKAVFVNDSEIEDDMITLTLANTVASTQNVTFSYVPGTLRLTDLNNNPAGYVNLAPVKYTFGNGKILSATLQGDKVYINFRDALQAQTALTASQFSVQLGGTTTNVLNASISGSIVTLNLSNSATAGQTGTVSYTPGAVPLRDALNNTIAAFGPLPLQQNGSSSTGNQTNSRPSWLTEQDSSSYGQALLVMSTDTAATASMMSRNNRSTRQFNVDSTKLLQAFQYATTTGKTTQPVVFEVPASESSAYVGFPLNTLAQVASSNRTGSIGVKYGDRLWMVPLSNLNVSAMSQAVGGNTTNTDASYFYVQVETVPVSSSGTIDGMLAVAGAQKLGNVTDIYLSAFSGNTNQRVEQNIKSQLAMQLPVNTPTATSGFTYIDPTTLILANVPHTFASTTGGVVVKGQLNGNQTIVPVTHSVSYQDTSSHWAGAVIKELSSKWIIGATNGSYYGPNQKITRAEFAELVAKGLGLKGDQTAARRFRDIRGGDLTSAYIGAAAEAGIITGNTDGTFKPESEITREQMAIMMVRAMNYGGKTVSLQSSVTSTLSKFKDSNKIQSKDSVAKAVQEGIIQGMTARTFEPQGNATRAQAAVMLKRVLDKLGYL